MTIVRLLPLSLSLLALGACTASAQNRTEAPMTGVQAVRNIHVNGTGEAKAPSDEAFLDVAVETEGKTAKAAGDANAKLMEAVRAALLAAGLQPGDLETGRYNVYPEYSGYGGPEPRKPTIQGYRATNQLTVHTKQLDQLGAFIDKALAAGANRVENVRFGLSNPEEAQGRALQDAVKRARRSAEVIAASLGVKLGEVLEANTVAQPLPPVPMMMKMGRASMESADTPITPAEQTIEARVELRFAIVK